MRSQNDIAQLYFRFGEIEARGSSPIYERLARHVARSHALLDFLGQLPAEKQQANLFFGAARHLGGPVGDPAAFENFVCQHADVLRKLMLAKRTQTNEAARCAVLLPILAQIGGPLSLIEVGASAGLCLLPDLYGYDFGNGHQLPAHVAGAPMFTCEVRGGVPLPTRHPQVVWRRGLDLNPLSVSDDEHMNWLRSLIWPEHEERRENFDRAVKTARQQPPQVQSGDLTETVAELIEAAPEGSNVVVFHTAVLSYVSDPDLRQNFAKQMLASTAYWISNESPNVFPQFAPKNRLQGKFLACLDGQPLAWTGPHGQSIDWISN